MNDKNIEKHNMLFAIPATAQTFNIIINNVTDAVYDVKECFGVNIAVLKIETTGQDHILVFEVAFESENLEVLEEATEDFIDALTEIYANVDTSVPLVVREFV